ncbi:MAG: site-specific integrase [Coriobacteriia bacterium]|nr:site-specific integrase [Coriobacteriia bacterium]
MTIERRTGSNGEVSYTARLSVPGSGRVCLGTFKQRRQAEAAIERAQELLADGANPDEIKAKHSLIAFKEFVETEYLPRFSGRTASDYSNSCKVLTEHFGAIPVARISSRDVDHFLPKLSQYSDNYGRKLMQRFRQVMNLAVKHRLIAEADHPFPKSERLPSRKATAVVKTSLNKDSAAWILEHLRQEGQKEGQEGLVGRYWHNLLFVARHTGARRSEWLGLTVSDLDPDTCTISFSSQWNWSKSKPLAKLKTDNAKRTIPLSPEVFERIWLYAHEDKGGIEPDLIFPRPTRGGGWGLWESQSYFTRQYNDCLERVWQAYQEKVEPYDRRLTQENFLVSTHQWRHLYATQILRSRQVDVHTVSRWLGHHDPSFTFAVYSSALDADSPDLAARAAAVLNGTSDQFL